MARTLAHAVSGIPGSVFDMLLLPFVAGSSRSRLFRLSSSSRGSSSRLCWQWGYI